ncbi:MAG TPA: DUF3558 family protein [Candidatus Limnocylindrales bacterium]
MLLTPRTLAQLSLGLLVVSLAACSGGTTPSTAEGGAGTGAAVSPAGPAGNPPVISGRGGDPCALLSDEEIHRTTGFPVLTRRNASDDQLETRGCRWELDSGTPGTTWTITLDVVDPGGQAYFDENVAIDAGRTNLSEFGERASNQNGIVSVVDGDTLITMFYTQYPSPEGDDDPTIPLLKLILDHVRGTPTS